MKLVSTKGYLKKKTSRMESQEPETIQKAYRTESTVKAGEAEEYEIVEREIFPEKIICPDCGGVTLEGLEFCHKCGGELN